jgi:hypothetical protein
MKICCFDQLFSMSNMHEKCSPLKKKKKTTRKNANKHMSDNFERERPRNNNYNDNDAYDERNDQRENQELPWEFDDDENQDQPFPRDFEDRRERNDDNQSSKMYAKHFLGELDNLPALYQREHLNVSSELLVQN